MITIETIFSHPTIVEELGSTFDFYLELDYECDWFEFSPHVNFDIIARKKSGSLFLAIGDGAIESRPVMYVDSEGQAGRVSENLTQLIGILLCIPYWQDALSRARGSLDEMRKQTSKNLETCERDYPDLIATRERITKALNFQIQEDPVGSFCASLKSREYKVVAEDGYRFGWLF